MIFEWLRKLAESIFDNLGIIIAPIAVAMFTSMSTYSLLEARDWGVFATVSAVAVGFSLEAGGFMSFKAFQSTGNWKVPAAYILILVSIAVTIEGLVHNDFPMMAMNLVTAAIVCVVYWATTEISSEMNALDRKIAKKKTLDGEGYKMDKNGNLHKKSTAKPTEKPTATDTAKPLRKNSMPPEVKGDVLQLTYSEFTAKYAGQFAVKERSYYNWRKEFGGSKVLEVA